jgi:Zn-dependent peptidase ImmA (M78 family)
MNHLTITPSQQNILATLRSIVPNRQLGYQAALQLAEKQAEQLRSLLSVHKPRFPHEALMDLPKIIVEFERDMPVSGSAHWNGVNWLILLNSHDSAWRQRFSLAHEFKHIIDHTHRHLLYRGDSKHSAQQQAERVADYFAGCLLVPATQLTQLYYQGVHRPSELSPHFQVSPRAIQYRLKQVGLMTQRCGKSLQVSGNVGYNRGATNRTSL